MTFTTTANNALTHAAGVSEREDSRFGKVYVVTCPTCGEVGTSSLASGAREDAVDHRHYWESR